MRPVGDDRLTDRDDEANNRFFAISGTRLIKAINCFCVCVPALASCPNTVLVRWQNICS